MSTTTTPAPKGSEFVRGLLDILLLTTSAIEAATTGAVQSGAEAAGYILKIVQAGAGAYQAQTGQPLDPTLLHQVPLIDDNANPGTVAP